MKKGGKLALRQRRERMEEEDSRRVRTKIAPPIDVESVMRLARGNPDLALELLEFTLASVRDSIQLEELQQRVGGAIMGAYLKDAPTEVLLKIAMGLPIPSVKALCVTNRQFAEVCNAEWFWQQRAKQDFNVTYRKYPTWKESYRQLTNQPPPNMIRTYFQYSPESKLLPYTIMPISDEANCVTVVFRVPNFTSFGRFEVAGGDGYPVTAFDQGSHVYVTRDENLVFHAIQVGGNTCLAVGGPNVETEVIREYGEDAFHELNALCDALVQEGLTIVPRHSQFNPNISVEEDRAHARDFFKRVLVDGA